MIGASQTGNTAANDCYFLAGFRFCGWQSDSVLRLFRKSKGRYQKREVHADVELGARDHPLTRLQIGVSPHVVVPPRDQAQELPVAIYDRQVDRTTR